MTDAIELIAGSPAERIEALADRPRRVGGSQRSSKDFETLLAEAASREAGRAQPRADALTGRVSFQPRSRPVGALGAGGASLGGVTAGLDALGLDALGLGAVTGQGLGLGLAGVAGSAAAGSPAGEAVVAAAAEHLGVPYLWGGTDPEKGFDCSGLIQHAYRDIGVEMPKWSRHQAKMGVEVPSIDEALPGDVISFGDPVTHVALYAGDGNMLHAPKAGEVVKIEPIDRPIASIRRIVAPGGPVAPVGGRPAVGATVGALPGAAVTAGAVPAAPHSPGQAERQYQPLFESAGARWGVDPALLAAVAKTESAFDPRAVSSAGAQGLMQFMPATAAEMGVDPWDPASAIDGAARYLRTSLDQFGSADLAIASYNAGRGAVSRHGGIPPFRETQDYVRKVLDAWRERT